MTAATATVLMIVVVVAGVTGGWFVDVAGHAGWWGRRSRETAAAAVAGFGGLIYSVAFATPVFTGLYAITRAGAGRRIEAVWDRLPGAVVFVVAYILWDAAAYAHHRFCHTTRFGWATHAPHHTGTLFNLSLALRQSWTSIQPVAPAVVMGLCGVPLPTAAAVSVVSNTHQAFQHLGRCPRLPRLVDAAFMTPISHRVHHEAGAAGRAENLGASLTVWDRLFRTWQPEPGTGPIGNDDRTATNPFAAQLTGWRRSYAALRYFASATQNRP